MSPRRQDVFSTIRTEGALLPTDTLALLADAKPDLPGVRLEDYHLSSRDRFNEVITRAWNALLGHWATFADELGRLPESDVTATSLTRERWLLPLFDQLHYGRLQAVRPVEIDAKTYPISHQWGHVPIHLVGARLDLDRRTPGARGAAGMSPHAMVQELLNRSDERLWGMVSNGRVLRLLRDNASFTRQAYVEFDLEAMFSGQVFADFAVLWMVCHQSRVEAEPPETCWLEQWVNESAARGTRALDALRGGVEQAIEALGRGLVTHPTNSGLREVLRRGDLDEQGLYRQLLRLVYRLLFLFVAEDRGLLFDPHAPDEAKQRYRAYYSLGRVRTLAQRRRGSAHADLWRSLQVVFDALGSDEGLPGLGLPALGSFLWSSDATPDLNDAELANRHLLTAVRALAVTSDARNRAERPVDYRNLGAEELGSVYESLLELHPVVDLDASDSDEAFRLSTAAGHERKTTGSYYTPTSLITSLLDTALEPVLDEKIAAKDPAAALLSTTVLDPACGSGHFLVAAAHRIARRLAAVRTGEGEPSPDATRTALRDVVGRCLYGIDQNEMAVELCKVSLWMEALEPGKPLSFLDQRIACGNALLGATPALLDAGIPDEAFKELTGDDKEVLKALRKRNKLEREGQGMLTLGRTAADLQARLAAAASELDAMDDANAVSVRAKEHRWLRIAESPDARNARLVADAWCAAFVIPKVPGGVVVTEGVFRQLEADPSAVDATTVDEIERLAAEYGFLHWHLAFPQVLRVPKDNGRLRNAPAGWTGGFDLVLGNPPWERVKLAEKEFFAARAPQIAGAPNAAARRRMIAELATEDPKLHGDYLSALRHADGESHLLRSSGRYPLCGRGDVNTYAVFAEAMRSAVGLLGQAGVIVPSGIATDDTTKFFFGDLVERNRLVGLFSFENEEFIFPAVHHATRFCLLTMSGGARTAHAAEFVFFARKPADLVDQDRRFSLTPEDFALLNPNSRTCPVFRSRRDAELTKAIYRRVPVLVFENRAGGNPWQLQFLRMIDLSNDSQLFHTREQLERSGWTLDGNVFRKGSRARLPLYEAKMFHQFNHRWGTYHNQTEAQARQGKLPESSALELVDPTYTVWPQYWLDQSEVASRAHGWPHEWFVAFRDITGATVLRTVIPSVLPRAAVGNSAPLLLASAPHCELLGASLSSFALDFVARSKVGGTHLNFFIAEQLPVLPPDTYDQQAPWEVSSDLAGWVAPRVLELTYTAWDIQSFAADLGYDGPPFRWDEERRTLLRAELDACFFHLYGIERDDVDYMMETFPIVKRNDEAAHGEYRTKRLILECYDAMAKAAESGEPYQTILDPPPADPSVAHPSTSRR